VFAIRRNQGKKAMRDMFALMKQAQEMQTKMQEMQAELERVAMMP